MRQTGKTTLLTRDPAFRDRHNASGPCRSGKESKGRNRRDGGEKLAARVERAEAGLILGGVEGARRRDPEGGFLSRDIAGGWATWGGEGSPLNKIVGLGFHLLYARGVLVLGAES